MQMLSRDSTRPENNKKSLNKNGNTFCCELLNRTGLGQCVMQASTKLCLAFFEFFTVLENKRFFQCFKNKLFQTMEVMWPNLHTEFDKVVIWIAVQDPLIFHSVTLIIMHLSG